MDYAIAFYVLPPVTFRKGIVCRNHITEIPSCIVMVEETMSVKLGIKTFKLKGNSWLCANLQTRKLRPRIRNFLQVTQLGISATSRIKILIWLISNLTHFKFSHKSFGLLWGGIVHFFFNRKFNCMNYTSFKLMVMLTIFIPWKYTHW